MKYICTILLLLSLTEVSFCQISFNQVYENRIYNNLGDREISILDVLSDSSQIYFVGSINTTFGARPYLGAVDLSCNLVWDTILPLFNPKFAGRLSILKTDSNGSFYAAGYEGSDLLENHAHLVKFNRNGVISFHRNYRGFSNQLASMKDMHVNHSNIFLIGDQLQQNWFTNPNSYLAKFKLDGTLSWHTLINPNVSCDAGNVRTDSTGKIFVTTTNVSSSQLYKYSAGGNVMWDTPPNWNYQSSTKTIDDIHTEKSGNTFLFGTERDAGSSEYELVISKIDFSGKLVWGNVFKNGNRNYAKKILLGDALYCFAHQSAPADSSTFVLCYDTAGTIQWTTTLDKQEGFEIVDAEMNKSGDTIIVFTKSTDSISFYKISTTGNLVYGSTISLDDLDRSSPIEVTSNSVYYGRYNSYRYPRAELKCLKQVDFSEISSSTYTSVSESEVNIVAIETHERSTYMGIWSDRSDSTILSIVKTDSVGNKLWEYLLQPIAKHGKYLNLHVDRSGNVVCLSVFTNALNTKDQGIGKIVVEKIDNQGNSLHTIIIDSGYVHTELVSTTDKNDNIYFCSYNTASEHLELYKYFARNDSVGFVMRKLQALAIIYYTKYITALHYNEQNKLVLIDRKPGNNFNTDSLQINLIDTSGVELWSRIPHQNNGRPSPLLGSTVTANGYITILSGNYFSYTLSRYDSTGTQLVLHNVPVASGLEDVTNLTVHPNGRMYLTYTQQRGILIKMFSNNGNLSKQQYINKGWNYPIRPVQSFFSNGHLVILGQYLEDGSKAATLSAISLVLDMQLNLKKTKIDSSVRMLYGYPICSMTQNCLTCGYKGPVGSKFGSSASFALLRGYKIGSLVGLQEVSQRNDNNINTYPNPANTYINIQVEGLENGIAVIQILNLQGQIISHENISINSSDVDHTISIGKSWSNGPYLVRVINSEDVYIGRFHVDH